jgi:hypothetical protein
MSIIPEPRFLKIANNNIKNIPSDTIYDNFNKFIFSNDIKIIGKLLYRFEYFLKVKDLPGDIVEVGVFKGSGVATFSKFLEIYCPNSNKKILGFDIFDTNNNVLDKDTLDDKNNMKTVYDRVDSNDLTLESVNNNLNNMEIDKKYILIKGDLEETMPKFLKENPGFKASFIYIDVDIERPTYYALKYLWDRLLPGGVILFDEYEYHCFSESIGVDKFLKEFNLEYTLKSTNWLGPTTYIIKK